MCLTSTEVRLEFDDWVPALAREALQSLGQQIPDPLGDVGAPEELPRIAVLVRPLAPIHLADVRRELGLLISPRSHVGVGGDNLAPALVAGCGTPLCGRERRLSSRLPGILFEA